MCVEGLDLITNACVFKCHVAYCHWLRAMLKSYAAIRKSNYKATHGCLKGPSAWLWDEVANMGMQTLGGEVPKLRI